MDSIPGTYCLIFVLTLQLWLRSADAYEPPEIYTHQAILETEVISAELIARPYGTRLPYAVRARLGKDHSALRVTLVSGLKCVVQKGDNQGSKVGTTVTCDGQVINNSDWHQHTLSLVWYFTSWPLVGQPVVRMFYGVTVGMMIVDGGQDYSEMSDNCHTTVKKLLALGVDPRDKQGPSTGAPPETCMCVTGQNVNARDSPSLKSNKVASLGPSDCHVYNGGDAEADEYTWKKLQNVNGNSAWVAVNFLVEAPAYRCASTQNETHSTSQSDTCFCVHGAKIVNARSGPLIPDGNKLTNVVTKLRKRECHIHTGGNVSAAGITWYELKDVEGANVWVSANYLVKSPLSVCMSTSTHGHKCTDSDAKDYACKILKLHNSKHLILARNHPSGKSDNAFAYNNIEHACRGRAAARSSYNSSPCTTLGGPGGYVCLARELLKYIYEIGKTHKILVNEIAGAVHSCSSLHYEGKAVDLHNDANGTQYYINHCNTMFTSQNCCGILEGNHVHSQFGFEELTQRALNQCRPD